MEFFPAHNQPARAAVLISHGYAEHLGRYRGLIEALNRCGFDAYGYNHRAHGEVASTPGVKRAQVDVGTLIQDHLRARAAVIAAMEAASAQLPLYLFGHSMGGLITAASVQANSAQVAGVVLSGPALRPLPRVPLVIARAGRTLARIAPGLPTAKLDAAAVSRDPQQVQAYQDDPLNYHGAVALLTATSMVLAGDKVLRTPWPGIPTFVIHGTQDRLADVAGARQFARMSQSITLEEVEGGFHEVLNDSSREQSLAHILDWLIEQTDQK